MFELQLGEVSAPQGGWTTRAANCDRPVIRNSQGFAEETKRPNSPEFCSRRRSGSSWIRPQRSWHLGRIGVTPSAWPNSKWGVLQNPGALKRVVFALGFSVFGYRRTCNPAVTVTVLSILWASLFGQSDPNRDTGHPQELFALLGRLFVDPQGGVVSAFHKGNRQFCCRTPLLAGPEGVPRFLSGSRQLQGVYWRRFRKAGGPESREALESLSAN